MASPVPETATHLDVNPTTNVLLRWKTASTTWRRWHHVNTVYISMSLRCHLSEPGRAAPHARAQMRWMTGRADVGGLRSVKLHASRENISRLRVGRVPEKPWRGFQMCHECCRSQSPSRRFNTHFVDCGGALTRTYSERRYSLPLKACNEPNGSFEA